MSSSIIDQVKLDFYFRKMKQGERRYLKEIYEMMYHPIFKYTFSLIRDYHQAEDITQEIFLRTEKYIDKYQSGTKAKAWLYKMTKNLVYTKMQKFKKEQTLEQEKLDYIIDKQLIHEEADLSFVKDALNILTEKEKQVVTLHIYGGLKHYETAKVLNISYEKVRSTYTYALRKVEKKLRGLNNE